MARRGERQLVCPDCGKRGVRHSQRPRGEDGYWCVYCSDFDAFTCSDSRIDWRELVRLEKANPGAEIYGIKEACEGLQRWGEL